MTTTQATILAFGQGRATVHVRCATDHPSTLKPIYADKEQSMAVYCDVCQGILPLKFNDWTYAEMLGYADAGNTVYRHLLDNHAMEVARLFTR